MAKKSAEAETPSFEQLLAEAETLAERMEEGGLSLDDSLAAYARGVENLRLCAGLLKQAEEKVKLLVEEENSFRLEDLDKNDDVDGDGGEDED
jgi:Exonuclease VII small subunit